MLYEIAITIIPGIGDILAKKLIAYCGNVEAVFKEKKAHLNGEGFLKKGPDVFDMRHTATILTLKQSDRKQPPLHRQSLL